MPYSDNWLGGGFVFVSTTGQQRGMESLTISGKQRIWLLAFLKKSGKGTLGGGGKSVISLKLWRKAWEER